MPMTDPSTILIKREGRILEAVENTAFIMVFPEFPQGLRQLGGLAHDAWAGGKHLTRDVSFQFRGSD